MKLAHLTWKDVDVLARDIVVVIPTGSLEQHGPHLPLMTDTLLATAVAEAAEARLVEEVLLTPTLWLGASGHHLKFSGTLSAGFDVYMGAIRDIVESLLPHGFRKFFLVNGHGGNAEPNGVAMRQLKARYPNSQFGHANYYTFAEKAVSDRLVGPAKTMRHACEAEASMVMYLRPDLVRTEKLRDDGLQPVPAVLGMVHHFDEISEEGSLGYATLATPEKGKAILDAAVDGLVANLRALAQGYVFEGE
ncbi:MAG: creatininase family protein [Fimbriimonadaceae bacterium]|nr:creatininase family protein [Fimbriimonadaceae bacterium]